MGIFMGSEVSEVWDVDDQGVPHEVAEVWDVDDAGVARLVWQNLPTEIGDWGTGTYSARDWLRDKLAAYGENNYQTVEVLPFRIDSSEMTTMRNMFRGCSSLVSVPPMDTSSVTDMSYMLHSCSSLVSVPPMDTSNVTAMSFMLHSCSALVSVPPMDTSSVTNMREMFRDCSSLVSVPPMDTSNVTNVNYMFQDCSALVDGNVHLIRSNGTLPGNRNFMIRRSGLTREPFFDANGNPIP